MARISTYQTDTDVIGSDKVIGTDFSGNVTKNYTLTGIGKFLSKTGRVAVNRQLAFFFQSELTGGRQFGSMSLLTGGVGDLATTTQLVLSKKTADGRDHDILIAYGEGKKAFIFSAEDPNTFAKYDISTIIDHPTDSSCYLVTLSYVEGQGSFYALDAFGFAIYEDQADKHYQHVQSISSAVWTITHNLNKRPSITVVDSADTTVIGEIKYTNQNTAQITFKAPFKGKAYCN